MPPITRKLAHAINEAELALKRIEKRLPEIQTIELECLAWQKRQAHYNEKKEVDPITLKEIMSQLPGKEILT